MNILFVYQEMQSFIRKDLDILSFAGNVRPVRIKDTSKFIGGLLWCDVTFSWFGKFHAFLAVMASEILGKKSIVIAGGDDVSSRTQTGRPYGVFSSFWKGLLVRWLFRHADIIIAVSEFARNELLKNTGIDQGKVIVVYHGFDKDEFCRGNKRKTNSVVTVGTLWEEDYYRKGYGYFIECARLMPDHNFFLVGPARDSFIYKHIPMPGNVKVLDKGLYGKALVELFGEAPVYLQLSEWETFGCAVAEAMLCECVPVVTRFGALPEVAGDCGIYVDSFDSAEIENKIRRADAMRTELGAKARQRIINEFPISARKDKILEVMEKLFK